MKSCSFCNKTQDEVSLLIESRNDASICDECVEVCIKAVFHQQREKREQAERCQGLNGECKYAGNFCAHCEKGLSTT